MKNSLRIAIVGILFFFLPSLKLVEAIWSFYPGKKSKKGSPGIERVLKGNKKMTAIILLCVVIGFFVIIWAIQNEFTRANSTVCTYYQNGTEIECHKIGFH